MIQETRYSVYQFEHDWFSWHIPKFTHYLAPLREIDCRLLEIGTHEGRCATWLLDNIAIRERSRLVCVDKRDREALRSNLAASGGASRVDVHIGPSRDVLKTLEPGSFDFVYIDGSHGQIEVLEDAVFSFRLARTGAILCFDDYLWDDPTRNSEGTPKISIDAFLEIYRKKIEVLERKFQVWVRKLSD